MRVAWGPDGPGGGPQGRRVAVTGMGVVAPCGVGLEAFWSGLLTPGPPTSPRRVEGFDAAAVLGAKEARRLDRFSQLGVAAALMAAEDSGATPDPDRAGVVIGTGIGGMATLEQQFEVSRARGPDRVSPFLVPMVMPNATAAAVSLRLRWRGPCEVLATACAAGTHAIAHGAALVASGRCQAVLAGAAEAILIPVAEASFANMTVVSPSRVCRPFDRDRDGLVLGEGAAVVLLEDLERAERRGARIYAELSGAASTADAHHVTVPAPGGAGAAACMELALADAGIAPADVGHINAHGTGTQLNDLAEAQAIGKVFGSPGPPVTSVKGVVGHTLGAAGAIEAVAAALTIHHGLIPPTGGFVTPDPEIALDVVAGTPRPFQPAPVLSNSFGFGGHNGCLVFVPPGSQ